MAAEPNLQIPILTDAIGPDAAPVSQLRRRADGDSLGQPPGERETLIAELQTQLAASTFALTDEVMRTAFAEMEASVFEQITGRLRRELPEMIDTLLRERLGQETDY